MKNEENDIAKVLGSLKNIKERVGMYFGPDPKPNDLFNFLMGWDMSRGTRWCLQVIERISDLKNTGSLVPDDTHISFEEALDIAMNVITAAGDEFSDKESQSLAFLIWKRFGWDMKAATNAWNRMFQTNISVEDFDKLLSQKF